MGSKTRSPGHVLENLLNTLDVSNGNESSWEHSAQSCLVHVWNWVLLWKKIDHLVELNTVEACHTLHKGQNSITHQIGPVNLDLLICLNMSRCSHICWKTPSFVGFHKFYEPKPSYLNREVAFY